MFGALGLGGSKGGQEQSHDEAAITFEQKITAAVGSAVRAEVGSAVRAELATFTADVLDKIGNLG